MADIELAVELREGTGKGAARAARRQGQVPGVIYGGDTPPVAINVKFSELLKMLKSGGFMSHLLELKVDGKTQKAICRGVQRDVVKDLPTHVDFLRITEKTRINMNIPVVFHGEEEAPGLKMGGVLTVIRAEVELMVTAGNIPDQIDVDISKLEIGDSLSISDVTLPEGSRPIITDRDFAIANIAAPKVEAEATEEEDGAEEGEDGEATEAPAEEGGGAEEGGEE